MLDQITQVLATTTTVGTFATRWVCSAKDLHLDVVDVGTIELPISSTTARRLHEVGRPAPYGLRDQTLLDKRVRDGHIILKDAFRIDARRWRRTMDAQLIDIARDLGLPTTCRLRAELHDLLVYGPSQFFATHQDSEKADGMVGSLVVVLPSKSKGGELVIEHHDEKVASVQLALSKSTARNQQVLSGSIGYTPITCPPARCFQYAASSAGKNFWFLHSPHFTFGSSHKPFANLFAHAGP